MIARAVLKRYASKHMAQSTKDWYEDPTKDLPPNVPRLNEDERTTYWEGERRRKLMQEAQVRAINRLPGWVQKWLREAETILSNRTDGSDVSIGDAVSQTMPDMVPGVSEETYDYYDELVPQLLREHYRLVRQELFDESERPKP